MLARLIMVPARRAALMAMLSIGCIKFRTYAVGSRDGWPLAAPRVRRCPNRGNRPKKPGRHLAKRAILNDSSIFTCSLRYGEPQPPRKRRFGGPRHQDDGLLGTGSG